MPYLSPTEKRVFAMLLRGMDAQSIGQVMDKHPGSINNMITVIAGKFDYPEPIDVHRRPVAALMARHIALLRKRNARLQKELRELRTRKCF